MSATPQIALTVSELEPGEFHWVLMEAVPSLEEDFMSFAPAEIGERPHSNAVAAWVAGYLALRKLLRRAATPPEPGTARGGAPLRKGPPEGRFA